MALTVPAHYDNTLKTGNFQENWIFQLYYEDETNFTGLAYHDTVVDTVDYMGIVSNAPSIKQSIDIFKSVAKTGNVSITVINKEYRDYSNTRWISQIIHSKDPTDNQYIGRKLKIYSQLNNNSSLSNCLELFVGKIKSIEHDINSVTINAINLNVFDEIDIHKKTSDNIPIPLVFGKYSQYAQIFQPSIYSDRISCSDNSCTNYSPIDAKIITDSNRYNFNAFRPVLHAPDINVEIDTNETFTLKNDRAPYVISDYAQDYTYNNPDTGLTPRMTMLYYYDKAYDKFLPLYSLQAWNDNTEAHLEHIYDQATSNHNGAHYLWTDRGIRRGFAIRPVNVEITEGSSYLAENTIANLFDESNSSYVGFSLPQADRISYPSLVREDEDGDTIGSAFTKIQVEFKKPDGTLSHVNDEELKCKLLVKFQWFNINRTANAIDVNGVRILWNGEIVYNLRFGTGSASITDQDYSANYRLIDLTRGVESGELLVEVYDENPDGETISADFRLYDIIIIAEHSVKTDENEFEVRTYTDPPEEILYSNADGIKATFTGSTADNPITSILEAHRELLYRYTDIGTTTPINYDELLTLRNSWNIRDTINEPTTLSDKLNQYQYEGGFIYTQENDTPKYIFIKSSYGSEDVVFNINENDYKNINIALTDNVITKWNVSRNPHPAKDSVYIYNSEHETEYRNQFGFGYTNENVKYVKLDALVRNSDTSNDGVVYNGLNIPTNNEKGIVKYNVSDNKISNTFDVDAGHVNYYAQLHARPRAEITLTLINPKFYKLQCGDIVAFENSDLDKLNYYFGDNLNNIAFIVTSISKKIQNLKVTLLELGL
tara:strand:+ start:11018 stop:13504 length:2487 start_codon:yes stop_codon:yes gene_type:complete